MIAAKGMRNSKLGVRESKAQQTCLHVVPRQLNGPHAFAARSKHGHAISLHAIGHAARRRDAREGENHGCSNGGGCGQGGEAVAAGVRESHREVARPLGTVRCRCIRREKNSSAVDGRQLAALQKRLRLGFKPCEAAGNRDGEGSLHAAVQQR